MKLARKLTLVTLGVVALVLAANAYLRVRRDAELVRDDIRRDHRSLGSTLAAVVPAVWREEGEVRALSLVEAANQQRSLLTVRWTWPERLRSDGATRQLTAGEPAELIMPGKDAEWLHTFVPVRLADGRVGAIEISESLAIEREQMRGTLLRTLLTTLVIATLAAGLTNWLGVWLVGKPVAQLMDKARRVGAGDLTGPLEIASNDELADLAREMNAMCERLAGESKARLLALDQLRHAERLNTLGRLAAGVAHELGTPLNVIGIEAKRIAVGRASGAAAQEGAGIMVEQVQRMSQIIGQLLDFARRRNPRTATLELADSVQEVSSLLAALARRQRVSLHTRRVGEARAAADRGQVAQLLTNLIVNAVQAMPEGGEVRLETGTGARADGASGEARPMAFVRVIDTGTGIAPEQRARIFEPFFTTKEVGQGTGLGLSVAHGIVEEHGGFIDVESEPGRGSCFTVWLPLCEGP